MKELYKFRFDIGFLRALSVLIVVFYHYKIPFFSGGFIGVDVFFVISGFLMTKIILDGFDRSNFNLKLFYEKRIKRIIPALLFILLFVLIISNIFFFNSDLKLNSKYVFLSATFISNIYYWIYSGYFDPVSQDNILLHTWSLSVEWQFYLIYPLLLLVFRSIYLKSKIKFSIYLLVITSVSLVAALFLTKDYNTFSFYMFPARAWEMTSGGLAFIYADFFKKKITEKLKLIFVFISIFVIIFCSVLIDESFLWPSYYTIIPVSATFLILSLNVNCNAFKNKIFQFIGKISYSLYLWHWPLFIILKYYGRINLLNSLLFFFISIFFASISFYCVEQNKFFSKLKVIAVFCIMIGTIAIYLFLNPTNKLTRLFSFYDDSSVEIINYGEKHLKDREKQFNSCGCFITGDDKIGLFNKTKCLEISKTKRNILLIGDSHSAQFSQSLREKLNSDNIIEVSAGFAFPFINSKGKKNSTELMNYVYNDFIPKNKDDIDIVLLSTHWLMYDNSLIGYSKAEVKFKILELIDYFAKRKIKLLIVGQTESYVIPFLRILAFNEMDNKNFASYIATESTDFNNYLMSFVPKENYIDVYELKGVKKFDAVNRVPYMTDNNHLTKFGADQIIDYIILNNYLK